MESEEPEIKSKQASKRDRTLTLQTKQTYIIVNFLVFLQTFEELIQHLASEVD